MNILARLFWWWWETQFYPNRAHYTCGYGFGPGSRSIHWGGWWIEVDEGELQIHHDLWVSLSLWKRGDLPFLHIFPMRYHEPILTFAVRIAIWWMDECMLGSQEWRSSLIPDVVWDEYVAYLDWEPVVTDPSFIEHWNNILTH